MPIEQYRKALNLPPGTPPLVRLVCIALSDYGNADGSDCHPSVATLRAHTGMSERHIQATLKDLIARKWILLSARSKGRKCNVYQLNFPEWLKDTPQPVQGSVSSTPQAVQGSS